MRHIKWFLIYLASNKTIEIIKMNAVEQIKDNLTDVENAIITPNTTVEVDCKITLNGNPTA